MPEFLHRLDLFHSNAVGAASGGSERAKSSRLYRLREAIPIGVRQAMTSCLPRSLQRWRQLKWLNTGIDWTRSKVFCIPSSDEACLRINLAGREPQGIVERGEYDRLIERLDRELRDLVNPLNAEAVVEHVVPVHAVFPGPRSADLPDVAIKWTPTARVSNQIGSPSLPTITLRAGYEVPPFYTGNHRNVAFAIARGPSLPANARIDQGHVIDIAPTIFDLLGVEPPPHFAGRSWAPGRS
jgi:predicted AlkP superfamily phosphohydrolase/phosphomutase